MKVGIARPSTTWPPHRDEEPEEAEEASRSDVIPQLSRKLSDSDDEHEVEEELEPRGVSRFVVVDRPQARRHPQAPHRLRRTGNSSLVERAQRRRAKTSPRTNVKAMMRFTSTAGCQPTSPSLITYTPTGLAPRPKPAPPLSSLSPPPPPPPPTFAAGMTVTPSVSIGSPNTRLTEIASRAPCSSSSTLGMSYLPLKSGLRFSMKAVSPSFASSEANAR